MSDELWQGPVRDEPVLIESTDIRQRFGGRVWRVQTENVQFPDAPAERDILIHPGAVAVIAVDDQDRVYLLRQYRHPVGMALFEPPAGLIDKPGEDPFETARREFAEEAGMEAAQWHTLVDFFNSPGGSSEAIRIYLARGISDRTGGRIMTGEAEEADLPGVWVPMDEAVGLVLAGDLGNPTSVIGVLAAAASRDRGWSTLRAPDAPWDVRDYLVSRGRVHTVDNSSH